MRRPPDGMDMRGSLRGSGGRGGVITQEELKRRIEHQQKQNEINMGQQQLIGSQQSQLMAMNQNQNLLKAKIYEQNHLRFRMPKSPSPLQSIGRPADFYGA